MTWADENKLGVACMDAEHRGLINAINALELAVGRHDGDEQAGSLLLNIADSSRRHFAEEEAMMTDNKYPGAALHVMKHQYLQQQLDALVVRFRRSESSMNEHSIKFLSDWLITHIQKEDRNFALWLNENGKR